MRNVDLWYLGAEHTALNKINLEIRHREIVAEADITRLILKLSE
ncbi:unnamed protein product [Mycetohabitans rhizoxinica HKI 454]|uniref:Uncharacterized protein n=1 Tax=Mycetohabitans rhizoxinica (strain DSM 19002 / CIP 109453 / HKI 454) TaxID=882378 RepID=E5AT20_MYCRK|nr:unnamed protein product [Mycetohabitans rhizoxinica HKI 454]